MCKRAGYRVIFWLGVFVLLGLTLPAAAQTPGSAPTVAVPASSYVMDVDFDPMGRSLAGSEWIAWTNTTGVTQTDLYLRLYPNAAYYHGGALVMSAITVDGVSATAVIGGDPTVARIPMPAAVVPGRRATIALRFRTSIPVDGDGSFGILHLDSRTGIWALADWYPVIAGYDAGEGWYLAPPSALGDPTFSATAIYDVRLTLPAGLAVAGTGAETGGPVPAGNGLVTCRFTTGMPAREFGLAVGTPGPTVTRTVDGVMLRVMTIGEPFAGSPQAALIDRIDAFTLDVAAAAFRAYTRWFGPYDQPDLDVAFLSLDQAQGLSMSGVTWISVPHMLDDGPLSDEERTSLAFTIAHEVGHQWLAGIIGSNNNEYGFITEGLDNSLTPAALTGLPLPATSHNYWRDEIGSQYLNLLQSEEDGVVDRPVSDAKQTGSRVALVYGKAPIGFEAICQRIGPDAYFAGLRAYGQRSWLGISTPAELRQALEDAARAHGEDPAIVGALWDHWFERAAATTAEANAVLVNAGSCMPAA